MPPEDTEEIDQVDRLPDDLLLHILSYVPPDAHCLARCSAVSRRFRHLVPLVPSLRIRFDLYIFIKTTSMYTDFCRSLCRFLFKRFRSLGTYAAIPSVTRHDWAPVRALDNFSNLRVLHVVIRFGEVTLNDTPPPASFSPLLRWRARFGSSLDRCLILAAASCSSSARGGSESVVMEDYDSCPESLFWILARAWTTLSLLSASARHNRFRPIITAHTNLESLVLTDEEGQGVIRMNQDQIKEMREKPPLVSYDKTTWTTIPEYRARRWYSPVLELSGGVVLLGATLMAVRTSSDIEKGEEETRLGWIKEEFDGDEEGMYAEAVQMLLKGGRTHYS